MVKIFLIGRYSVGKSSLFNSITKQRNIVLEENATTRDIIRYEMEWGQKTMRVADSAGLEEISSVRELDDQQKLIVEEMQRSDVILMVVDGAHGLHPQDEQLAMFLRRIGLFDRTILVVNKADRRKHFDENDFYQLGFSELFPVSAVSNYGVYELLDACVEKAQDSPVSDEEPAEFPAIAILGKPNVGKSTLFNHVLGQTRSYVQNQEFTTRDPIQEHTVFKGQEYKFIDTAGIRSKWMHEFGPIYLSMKRTEGIVKTADIALFMIDGTETVSREDQKIAKTIQTNGKACIIVVNKKDQIHDPHDVLWSIRTKLRFLAYSPVVFISAKLGQGSEEMFAMIQKTYTSYTKRFTTHEVNKMIRRIIIDNPIQMGERKILYVTQYATKPPRFAFFVNRPKMFTQPYINFFKNKIIESMDLMGTPVEIRIRNRKGESE